MNKKILIIVIIIVVILVVVVVANSFKSKISVGPLTAEEALKILKADAKCSNPESVEKIMIVTEFDQVASQINLPKGEYWKSNVFFPSNPGPGPSNGCWDDCYLDISNKNKIYYNSGCV